uniref:Uncharacterized protein n=1 Tax=Physcomitrium patens TaxID=3218 RepID=A0A2K1JXW4_PHYPA|nr:hypothetical protein PHYPA_013492 [Physcomitrium patens]
MIHDQPMRREVRGRMKSRMSVCRRFMDEHCWNNHASFLLPLFRFLRSLGFEGTLLHNTPSSHLFTTFTLFHLGLL